MSTTQEKGQDRSRNWSGISNRKMAGLGTGNGAVEGVGAGKEMAMVKITLMMGFLGKESLRLIW